MKQIINPIGKEINTLGKVIENKELMLVHLQLKSGEQVPSHDHKGQEVYFTIVKGTVEVTLDDTEVHRISTGTVLHFPGEAHVSVNAIEESDFFVYLINRQ
ncbi:cupin domain-containing protein [Porphyromonas uenonis]|uniref:cupin domain-containing protein n=1 Tax=Porphyromonas uenonis TaxID=281920 RepID=UPI002672B57E|nr:cupin domain-containing protein [Porphyromonas uenonis]